MTGRPDNPVDEAPAAWALWQWAVARIPAEEVSEFAGLMRGYRDEIRAETPQQQGVAGDSAVG